MSLTKLITICALLLTSGMASAQECYESSILSPTPFMGNAGEILKLGDGSLWQVKNGYEYLYEYYPNVVICPSLGKLAIKGKTLPVAQIGSRESTPKSQSQKAPPVAKTIESQIDGDFEGWEGETIVKLVNGQIWQQSEYFYHYHYAFMPKVLVYLSGSGYKMKIDGISKSVGVTKLK